MEIMKKQKYVADEKKKGNLAGSRGMKKNQNAFRQVHWIRPWSQEKKKEMLGHLLRFEGRELQFTMGGEGKTLRGHIGEKRRNINKKIITAGTRYSSEKEAKHGFKGCSSVPRETETGKGQKQRTRKDERSWDTQPKLAGPKNSVIYLIKKGV